MKLFTIAFDFASTLILVKCIAFLGGTNVDGNNDRGGYFVLPSR
jgi:hypothetical protein